MPATLLTKFAVFNKRGGYSHQEIESDAKLKDKRWNLFTRMWFRKGKDFLEDLV